MLPTSSLSTAKPTTTATSTATHCCGLSPTGEWEREWLREGERKESAPQIRVGGKKDRRVQWPLSSDSWVSEFTLLVSKLKRIIVMWKKVVWHLPSLPSYKDDNTDVNFVLPSRLRSVTFDRLILSKHCLSCLQFMLPDCGNLPKHVSNYYDCVKTLNTLYSIELA